MGANDRDLPSRSLFNDDEASCERRASDVRDLDMYGIYLFIFSC